MEFRYLAYFWYQLNFRPLIRFLGHHFDEVETQIILGFVSLKTLTFYLISLHIHSHSIKHLLWFPCYCASFFSWLLLFLSWHPIEFEIPKALKFDMVNIPGGKFEVCTSRSKVCLYFCKKKLFLMIIWAHTVFSTILLSLLLLLYWLIDFFFFYCLFSIK